MPTDAKTQVAVCGLHMKGFALNSQLTDLGATYVRTTNSAPCYKMYALATFPEKPGMVRVDHDGTSLEVEIWELTYEALGKFLTLIPSPLGLGQILLEDNTKVTGFICEPYGIQQAFDISFHKGWRYYVSAK